jgi:hypothetical protein
METREGLVAPRHHNDTCALRVRAADSPKANMSATLSDSSGLLSLLLLVLFLLLLLYPKP